MSKMNVRRFARPALLGAALMLTVAAMIPPVFAACTNGTTRTIIVNPVCCGTNPPKATKQNQKCVGGVWVNQGGTFCGAVSACAI